MSNNKLAHIATWREQASASVTARSDDGGSERVRGRAASVESVVGAESVMSDFDEDKARMRQDAAMHRLVMDTGVGGYGMRGDRFGVGSDEGSDFMSPESEFGGIESEGVEGDTSALDPFVQSDRRIAVQQLRNQMRRGRVIAGAMHDFDMEKRMMRFDPSEQVTVNELKDIDGVCNRMASMEVVEASMLARTGLGKTTILPGLVAKKARARVLLLVVDGRMAAEARDAMKASVRVVTRGYDRRMECVRVMTYLDFVTAFSTQNGKVLMRQNDVILLDESHIPEADVFAAGVLLATFKPSSLSVFKMSATHGVDDVQSAAGGAVLYKPCDLEEWFVGEGFFEDRSRVRDQTMIILPTDEAASRVYSAIEGQGYKAMLLDSASTAADVVKARESLQGTSASTRFLVTTNAYGTGANFPVRYVYTAARRAVWVINEGIATQELVPLTLPEVKQHLGRVGRKIVNGSGACVCLDQDEIAGAVTLLRSEMLRAYLLLRAAHVVPIKSLMGVDKFLPYGVTPDTAREVLAVNLPAELALRFFAPDGRLPARFARAIGHYSVEPHFLSSQHSSPFRADEWVMDDVGCYYGSTEVSGRLKVPLVVQGEMRVRVHAICALAMRVIEVDTTWMPDVDGSGSETEMLVVSSSRGAYKPRLLEHTVVPAVATTRRPEEWSYAVPIDQQLGPVRSRHGIHGDDVSDDLQAMLATAHSFDPTFKPAYNVQTDDRGIDRVLVDVSPKLEQEATPVSVNDEHGQLIVHLRQSIFRRLCEGEALDGKDVYSFTHAVKYKAEELARSDLFAYWGNAWISILRTFADIHNLSYVKQKGMVTIVKTLLAGLLTRYQQAVKHVVGTSRVKRRLWRQILDLGVVKAHERACKVGGAEVLQSQALYERIYLIRELFVETVRACESSKVFDAGMVTRLQDVLPISGLTGSKLIDGADRKGVKLIGN